jgi:hypothetical protein
MVNVIYTSFIWLSDSNNSTVTPLTLDVFIGTSVNVTNYSSVIITVTVDSNSSTNGLNLQYQVMV